ncbi:MAG: LysR substrate-binding domain-containing protein [Bradyrhizobium sp.]
MLNPRQVEAFRAVMTTGSVTSAATMMHVTQPAVSRLIRDLEASLKLALFERRGNRLEPTAEAGHLFAEVERTFVGLSRISQFAEELRVRRAGSLRIAGMPAVTCGFLSRLVGRFIARRPEVAVTLHGLPSHLIADGVAAGRYDFGIAEASVERPGLLVETLPIKAVAAVPQDDPLARRQILGPKDFEDRSFVSLGQATLFRSRIDATLAGVRRRQLIETQLTEIACILVAERAGVSLVDPLSASEFAGRGVVFRPFRPDVMFEAVILTPSARPMSALAIEVIDKCRSAVSAIS